MRAALYFRQSKERDDSISVEIQRAACRGYAEAKGWTIVSEVVDEGNSGTETVRPWRRRDHFPEVVALAEARKIDRVVIYRWSRLSRTRRAQIEITDLLESNDVTVAAATEDFDPTTAGGRFARDQMLSYAAFESDLKGEQWREALARREAAGLPKNGHLRFGYAKEGKTFVVDPVTGPVLADLYRRYAGGAGFQSLCGDLNDRGVTTTKGTTWQVATLSRALDSGFGAGLLIRDVRTTGKAEADYVPGAQEPVITEDEWRAYVDARSARKHVAPKRRTARWYLAGIATCGLCGGRAIVTTHKVGKSQVLCSGYHNRRTCTGVWLKRETLERAVTWWIGANVTQFPERDVHDDDAQTIVDNLEERLGAVQGRLTRLAEGYAEGLLDVEGYRGAQANALAERDQLEAELRHARGDLARLRPLTRDEWSRLEVGDAATPGEWNHLLTRVLRRVEIHPDRIVVVPVVGEAHEVTR